MDEYNLKQQADKMAYTNQAQTPSGSMGGCSTEPMQASLRERIRNQAARARRESRKADRLDELNYLLDKNPEVALILDLLEDAQRY